MYVCMTVCMTVCMNECMYVCMYIYIYRFARASVASARCTAAWPLAPVCNISTYIFYYLHIYSIIYIYTDICTHTYIYIHTCVCALAALLHCQLRLHIALYVSYIFYYA